MPRSRVSCVHKEPEHPDAKQRSNRSQRAAAQSPAFSQADFSSLPLRMLNVCGALILGTKFFFHGAGRGKWVGSLLPGKEQPTEGHVLKDWEGWHRQMALPVPSVVWLRGWPALEPWDLGVKGKLNSCAVPGEQAVLSRHQQNNWEKWFSPMFSVTKKKATLRSR